MRSLSLVASVLLFLVASTACATITDSGQLAFDAVPTQQQAAPSTPLAPSQNVAVLGTARASAGRSAAPRAIDGDAETSWNSREFPSQWFSVTLDGPYLVDRVELHVAQVPEGPTTHLLWLRGGDGMRTLVKSLIAVQTSNEQLLTIHIDPPRPVTDLLIYTLDSPSWVAWREVKVFGVSLDSQVEANGDPQLALEEAVSGLEMPLQATHAGDGSHRLFVVEQRGRVRIVRNGELANKPFLDITDRVGCCGERGLFNVAFPPTYQVGRHFYVTYTDQSNDTVLSRFWTSDDPDRADPDSEEVILEIAQPEIVHNGGSMAFGPKDGFLYLAVGDGGATGPAAQTLQRPGQFLGKILRIDVESGGEPYTIPESNPFTQAEGFRPEIWALGLRNPWGIAFDSKEGHLFIPDTGQDRSEEINYQAANSVGGENYGWPIMEGAHCHRLPDMPVPCTEAGSFALPIAEYDHAHGCAIVGGAVYRGSTFPSLTGAFVFADFCRGDIWALKPPGADSDGNLNGAWQSVLLTRPLVPISSIGDDEEGNLYATGHADGSVYLFTEN